jgi:hypothetical protein
MTGGRLAAGGAVSNAPSSARRIAAIGYEEGLNDWNTASGDPICQRRAVNQFHEQRGDTVRLLETVDVRDVGMIQ